MRHRKPRLIEQPHGGALLTGGVPGNKGGGRQKRTPIRVAAESLLMPPKNDAAVLDATTALIRALSRWHPNARDYTLRRLARAYPDVIRVRGER
jgi:hypothetical protein